MDRRTLLAVGMIGLVMLIYTVAFDHSPPPPVEEAAQEPTASTPKTETETPEPEPTFDASRPRESATDTAPESESARPGDLTETPRFESITETSDLTPIPIRNERVVAHIDPRGATVGHWRLQDYEDWQEQPVELVRWDDRGLFRLGISGPDGFVDLSDANFSSRFIQSRGEGPGAILEARSADGTQVRVQYVLDPGGYSGDVAIRVDGVRNAAEKSLVITFPDAPDRIERTERLDRDARAGVALVDDRFFKHNHRGKDAGWSEQIEGPVHWFGVRSKYFLATLVPEVPRVGRVRMYHDAGVGVATAAHFPLDRDGDLDLVFTLYGGPLAYDRLAEYDIGLEKTVDLGWSWIVPFSRLLLRILNLLHEVVPNYGLVIIILSVLTKVLFYPLTKKSMESMKGLQVLRPEMEKLNQKYKDDAQAKNQAMLELYKKHKINPMGGCLPIVIQMPVFIGLYSVLSSSIELRDAPFMLWINDLSSPDSVGSILGFPIHILPILMAATMFWQQKLTPTDPRQAAIGYIMPVMMLVFFYQLPSGLVLYWTVNNVLQVGQQVLMNRESKQELKAA